MNEEHGQKFAPGYYVPETPAAPKPKEVKKAPEPET